MNKLINTDRLSNTANAIRWCNGLTTQYKVMDFENAIYNCVNEYKKHIPNDTISITTNSLNILPSVLDLPIDSFTLQGNSYQASEPNPDYPQDIEVVKGRNLFGLEIEKGSISGDTGNDIPSSNRIRTNGYINVNHSTSYTLSFDITGNNGSKIYVFEYNENTFIKRIPSSWNIGKIYYFTTSNNTNRIRFVIAKENDNDLEVDYITNIQLEEGSTATPYVPYNNIGVTVRGKNIAKEIYINETPNRYQTVLYVTANLKPNTYYLLSYIDESVGNVYYRAEEVTNDFSSYAITSSGNRQYWTFHTKDNITPETNGYPIFKNNKIQDNIPNFKEVMLIEINSLAIQQIPYEEYKEQVVNIPLGDNELCKVGNVSDELVIKDGKAKIIKRIGKYNLNSSINWYAQDIKNYQCTLAGTSRIYLANSGKGLSNYFRVGSSGSDIFLYPILQSGIDYIRITNSKNKWETANDFKTWLSTHNTILYYQLATPTEIDLGNITIPKGSYIETLTNLDTTYSVKYFKGV